MKYHVLCFLDIDGTLLDSSYHNNCNELTATIKRLQAKGVVFILNSNRALEDLLPVAEEFGIAGLLIGENGIFVHDQRTHKTTLLIPPRQEVSIKKTVFTLPKAITAYMDTLASETPYHIMHADTVAFTKDSSRTERYPEGTILFLCNQFRTFTASVHVKRVNGTTFVPDVQTARECSEFLSKLPAYERFSFSVSELFANVLMYHRSVSKTSAVLRLKHNPQFSNYDCIAIGDEESDAAMMQNVGAFYTTANAQEQVKKKASITASHPYAWGVQEILQTVFHIATIDE